MEETGKQKESAPNRPNRKISRFIGRIQQGISWLLLWLASLLRAPQSRKEAAARFLRGAGTYMANMSPARFICILITITVIITVSLVYCFFPVNTDPINLTSPAIDIWFSEMNKIPSNMDYLPDPNPKTPQAISMIQDKLKMLSLFKILDSEPNESYPNRIDLEIMVGCYKKKDHNNCILEINIIDKRGKVEKTPITVEYNSHLENIDCKRIVDRIREPILKGYPPQGIVDQVPDINRLPFDENEQEEIEIILNVGTPLGIQRGDIFNIFKGRKTIEQARVIQAMDEYSAAIINKNKEVTTGCRIKFERIATPEEYLRAVTR